MNFYVEMLHYKSYIKLDDTSQNYVYPNVYTYIQKKQFYQLSSFKKKQKKRDFYQLSDVLKIGLVRLSEKKKPKHCSGWLCEREIL